MARFHPAPSTQQSRTERELDAALAATFPASDPVSMTQPGGAPETEGARTAAQRWGAESGSGLPSV